MDSALLNELYRTCIAVDADGKQYDVMHAGIPYDEGMAIYNYIRQTKPRYTLEVGMAYGLSALFACQAHADNQLGGVHTAIDPAQSSDFHSVGVHNVRRAGLENHLRFYEEPSYAVLPRLLASAQRFGFIFIDGMHVFDYVLVDFFYADLLLDVGCCIVLDDLWMPSVRRVVDYVRANRRYELATEWIWEPQPLYNRAWSFARKTRARKLKVQTAIKHQAARPLDFSTVTYLSKGSLKYQFLRKLAPDDRTWDYHRPF